MSLIARVAKLKTQNFTASSSFVVPQGVYSIIVNGTGAGGGYSSGVYATNAGGGSGGYVQNYRIAVTPGETLTITIGAGGTTTAGGNTTIYSSAKAANILVLGGGGPAVTNNFISYGGDGGTPNGNGGFAFSNSAQTSGLISGGCGMGTSYAGGQKVVVYPFKLPGMGKIQSGSNSGGLTPFMAGRGGYSSVYDGAIAGKAGLIIISWVE